MKLLLIFSIHNCMNNYPVLVLVFTLLFNVKNKSFSCFIYTTPELTTAKSSTFSLKRHLINLPLLDNPPHFNNIKANISYCLYRPFTFTKKKKKSTILYIRQEPMNLSWITSRCFISSLSTHWPNQQAGRRQVDGQRGNRGLLARVRPDLSPWLNTAQACDPYISGE